MTMVHFRNHGDRVLSITTICVYKFVISCFGVVKFDPTSPLQYPTVSSLRQHSPSLLFHSTTMAVLEVTKRRLNPGILQTDPTLLQILLFLREATNSEFLFYATIEDPTVILILGI